MMPPQLKRPCHVLICNEQVPLKFLMCRQHWFMIPRQLRDRIWAAYQPGQERGEVAPSLEWHLASDMAIKHVTTMLLGAKN